MKKQVKNIGLVLSGVVLGVAISFSGEISAATSKLLNGKVGKVMTVTLNDKSIGEAPVIGGTSYIPVRSAANSLGLGVKVNGNEIELSTLNDGMTNEEAAELAKQQQEEMDKATAEANAKNESIMKKKQEIETVKRKISGALRAIDDNTTLLERAKTAKSAGAVGMDSMIKAYEEEIESAKKNKSEQEVILADLEAQLAALDK